MAVLAPATPVSAQTLASLETVSPLEVFPETTTQPLDGIEDESSSLTPDLSATWQDRSGWRIGGTLFNPIDYDVASFGHNNPSLEDSRFSFDLVHPSFLTAGFGYQHVDGWRFGAEIHFIELVDTGGLDGEGFSTDIDAFDIQWNSSPVLAFGGVAPLGDSLSLSSGFTWNRNQVRPLDHAFNSMAPGLLQSSFNVGLRWQWSPDLHWFLNYRSGYADYLPADSTGALGNYATSHLDGTLDVVSLTLGVELAL